MLTFVLFLSLTEVMATNPPSDSLTTREWRGGLPWWEWSGATGDWNDYRNRLRDRGLEIEGSYILEVSKVESGGVRRRSTGRSLLDLCATLDLGPLLDLPDTTVSADFQSQVGRDASLDTGDFQVFDNVDAGNYQTLYELWVEQRFWEDRVRIKVGKVDANSEFAFVESGGDFINSSMGYSPTIFALPTFPDPAASINLFVRPVEALELRLGLYDGATRAGRPTGTRGARTFWDEPSDNFGIAEVESNWDLAGLAGRATLGYATHHGHVDDFDGGRRKEHGGFYSVVEQALLDLGEGRGLELFVQWGEADADVSVVTLHVGGGVVWTGPISSRPRDVAGFGVTRVDFTGRSGAGFTEDREVAYELFYKAEIFPWLAVTGDLQHITDPGGAGLHDVNVATVRVQIAF